MAPGLPTEDGLEGRLYKHVYSLAEEIGERNVYHPQALHAAEEYIKKTWSELGLEVQPQEYEVTGVRSANLEVSITGSSSAGEIILLGAHYDTVSGSPGANDNASGVAALLELSRLFLASSPKRTLRFVAFVNEEAPFFFTNRQGSVRYARRARECKEDIRLMLSLETMGYYRDEAGSQAYPPLFRFFYPEQGNFIAFVSNFRSRRQLRKLTALFRDSCSFPVEQVASFFFVPGVGWSDHLSFWRQGYRAVMVTDTAFYRYPYYHSPQDTVEKLDYTRLAAVTRGLHGAVSRLVEQGI